MPVLYFPRPLQALRHIQLLESACRGDASPPVGMGATKWPQSIAPLRAWCAPSKVWPAGIELN